MKAAKSMLQIVYNEVNFLLACLKEVVWFENSSLRVHDLWMDGGLPPKLKRSSFSLPKLAFVPSFMFNFDGKLIS